MPTDYDKEKWVEVYKKAIFELEHARITGRIGDARAEITERIEKLYGVPGLHAAEIQAIDDAYRTLRFLEGEEERHAAEKKSRALEEALHKLRSIAPKIEKLK
jgi:hypothetical protein